MLPSGKWKIAMGGEKRIFGQTVLMFNMKSDDTSQFFSQVVFCNFDLKDLLKSAGKVFSENAGPATIFRNLIGTGSGPLSSTGMEWVDVRCQRGFTPRELDGAEGKVQGGSAGFAFGYLSYTLEADGLFTADVSGITASMMFPTYSWSGEKGKWRVLSGVGVDPYKGDADEKALGRAGTRA